MMPQEVLMNYKWMTRRGSRNIYQFSWPWKAKHYCINHYLCPLSSVILWSHEYKTRDLIKRKYSRISLKIFLTVNIYTYSTSMHYQAGWKLSLRDEGQLNLQMCDLKSFVFWADPHVIWINWIQPCSVIKYKITFLPYIFRSTLHTSQNSACFREILVQ